MIELLENNKAADGYFNIVIDQSLLSGAWAFKPIMEPDVPFQYVAKGERICWRLASQTLVDFDPFVVITLNNIFGWMIYGHSVIISPEISDDDSKNRLTFGFYFAPNLASWHFEFSFTEYCSEFYEVYEADSFSEYELIFEETPALRLEILSDRFANPIMDYLISFEIDLKKLHESTVNRLMAKLGSKMVRTYFHFPEETKSSCEQYLLYFGKFLQDLGIEATHSLSEEDGSRVLFSVYPIDEVEALGKIREALAVYLHLPASPIDYDESFAAMRLQQQVENLLHSQKMAVREVCSAERELRLAETVIEHQDKIIHAKDSIIQQQQSVIDKISSKSIMMESVENKDELEEIYAGLKIGESKWLKDQLGIQLNPAKLIKTIVQNTFGKEDARKSILGLDEEETTPANQTLEKMLDGVTEENLHGETDFGGDVGKEVVRYED